MLGLEVLKIGQDYAVGKAHGVLILHLARLLPAPSIAAAKTALASGMPAAGYMQIFPPFDAFPGASELERKSWSALATQMKTLTRVGALVVPQGGFAGAALRAAISGVLLLARGPGPTQVVPSLDDGARYLVREGAVTPGATIAHVVDAARGLAEALAAAR
jgi:hypothetical protein